VVKMKKFGINYLMKNLYLKKKKDLQEQEMVKYLHIGHFNTMQNLNTRFKMEEVKITLI
jgi:hypothetical protein